MNKAIFSSVLKMDGGGAGKHQKLKINSYLVKKKF